jgi:RNA polymerase sporulation-specific sigma factor
MRRGAGLVAVGAPPADEDLVLAARAGDEGAMRSILDRYRSFARAKARLYYVAGGDRDDVVQEGMIGLFKAVRDFDENAGASFRAFADLCITRQVLTAVKAASRNKHAPLNTSLSLSRPVLGDEEGERSLADLLSAPQQIDPAEQVMSAERIRNLQRHVDEALSDLEVDVLRLHVDGRSYAEIAATVQRQTKAVDNALQRVKRKLEAHLRAREVAEAG